MTIAPVIGMSRKKAGSHSHRRHSVDLIFTSHLRMNYQRPGIRPRVRGHRGFDRIQTVVDRRVTIAVNRDLYPALIQPGNLPKKCVSRN